MKVFVRSASGLMNYHKFYGADFTAYVEGKVETSSDVEATKTSDICYYEYLLQTASGGKKPKVKCVGNKSAALEYAKRIRINGVTGSVVIVDKDLEEILTSPIDQFPIITTYGYSWENEIWTAATMVAVLDSLTNGNPAGKFEVEKHLPSLERRIKFLSLLDAAAQSNGFSILKKTSSLCGVAFDFPYVNVSEIKRVSEKFKITSASSCIVARELIQNNSRIEAKKIIQGHFWSNIALRLVSYIYRKLTRDSTPSNALLTNLALAHLKLDVIGTVGQSIVDRYRIELVKYGI